MTRSLKHFREISIWSAALLLVLTSIIPVSAARRVVGRLSHTAKQSPPILLGTSGGWSQDLANGYCCGGTLGSLVTDGQNQYVLSNFHVLASDVVSGDNHDIARVSDPIIQPGLIDVNCNQDNAQNVGKLSAWADPIKGTKVDAAIAVVDPGMVDPGGAILEIGRVSQTTVEPTLNLRVKKSGRTTGLTRSRISGINATVSISYNTECAGPARGTATFTNQIVVVNRGSKFLAAGDSGSLMVEDVASNPSPVGLLYAGSQTVAIAHPIGDVLDYFSSALGTEVKMVGAEGVQVTRIPERLLEEIKKVQRRNAERLEKLRGAVGHAIGVGRNGRAVIKVYVEKDTPEVRATVPQSVEGVPVEVEETGRIVPFSSCH